MKSIDLRKFPHLSSSTTKKLFDTLAKNDIEARFVGGCVREAMLGNSAHDIDVAVNANPDLVTDVLEKAGAKVVPTGIDHGTVTVVMNNQVYEVTSLRSDTQTYGRHADVNFGVSWVEDAQRRDFTINAMYLSISGILFDPCGGAQDLEHGRVRFIGQATKRIQEDYLRILRFFRFHARFGSDDFDDEAIKAIEKNIDGLDNISRERIRMELMKLLVTENCGRSLAMMQKTGVADVILPRGITLKNHQSLIEQEIEYGLPAMPLRHLYTILPKPFELAELAKRLRLTKKEQRWFATVTRAISDSFYTRPIHYQLYYLGFELALDINLLASTVGYVNELQGIIAAANTWSRPVFPISGKDLNALVSGPSVGKVLKAVEAWWVDNNFQPSYNECIEYAKTIVAMSSKK